MIRRQVSEAIRETIQHYPILSITGPRQSGKTTLLRDMFSDYRYVNFEEPDSRRFFQEDPRGFLKQYDQYVIFDEAQRVPELFSYLQAKTDEDRLMGQYLLSGSQNFLLLEKISQSLAGRVGLFRLLPLSHAEMAANNPSLCSAEVAEMIFKGGYPALYDRGLPISRFFQNYLETYVERPQFYFWQDSNKVEVDLIEIDGLQTHLYEMKYSYTVKADFFKGIRSFRSVAPPSRQEGENVVFYAGEEEQKRTLATVVAGKHCQPGKLPWRIIRTEFTPKPTESPPRSAELTMCLPGVGKTLTSG